MDVRTVKPILNIKAGKVKWDIMLAREGMEGSAKMARGSDDGDYEMN